jgi:tetratricopeptide (TPR) repeat protein
VLRTGTLPWKPMTTDTNTNAEAAEVQNADRPPETPLLREWWVRMGAIVALALALRIPYLIQIQSWPFFNSPILDSRTQYKWATILLNSHGIGNGEVVAKAPLYPYFLAFHQWLVGAGPPGLFSAHLGQLVLGAFTCGLVYLLGRRAFGEPAGIAAGLLAALYSPGIFRDGQLLDTALATFLATAFLLALLAAVDRPTSGRWLGAGLLLGCLHLTRPNLLLFAPVLAVATIVWFRRTHGASRVATMVGLLALGIVLPILPITGRNYLIRGYLMPVSDTGGINLYTGNNPDADGYSPIPSGIAWERTWYAAEEGSGSRIAREGDAFWRSEAYRFWREQPGRALALLLKKVYLYWNAYEIPNNVSYDWGRARASVLRVAPLTFAVLGPLSLLGIVLGGWRSRRAWALTLFVASNVAAVVAFFVCGRYRMPVLPALCVFAAFALLELFRYAAKRTWARLALALAALVVFAVFVNSDAYGVRRSRGANRDWYYIGQSYVFANDPEQAKQALRQAAEADPKDADARQLLGQMEMNTGEAEAAGEHLKQALEIAPDFTRAAVALAEIHLQQGWPLDEVEPLLRRAVTIQTYNVHGMSTLARVHLKQGKLDEAQRDLQDAVDRVALISTADTRRAPALQQVMQAAVEAQAAGVEIPLELRSMR